MGSCLLTGDLFCFGFYRTECLERWLLLKNCFKGKNFLYVNDGVMLCFYSLALLLCFCRHTQVHCFKLQMLFLFYLHFEKYKYIPYI